MTRLKIKQYYEAIIDFVLSKCLALGVFNSNTLIVIHGIFVLIFNHGSLKNVYGLYAN